MSASMRSITVRRLIKADRVRVFDAFSRSEALSHWFSPSPAITVEVLVFEFAPRGDFRLRYTMPDGSHPVVGGTYDRIAAPDLLAFSWIWEAPDRHADIPTTVHIEFFDKGDRTEIVLTHNQLPSKEACTRHAASWDATFDNLERSLEASDFPAATSITETGCA